MGSFPRPLGLSQMLSLGKRNRATYCTNMNERSSRSHALLTVTITGTNCSTGTKTSGTHCRGPAPQSSPGPPGLLRFAPCWLLRTEERSPGTAWGRQSHPNLTVHSGS